MVLQTRGSAVIDKAQRRLASLTSIDAQLDLGHGLTLTVYAETIEALRRAIEAHNVLVSNMDESRRNLRTLEGGLSELSTRMLSGVASKYGNTSNEYRKAGGNVRKSRRSTPSPGPLAPEPVAAPAPQPETNGSSNGKVPQLV
jgi:hypothetical protein